MCQPHVFASKFALKLPPSWLLYLLYDNMWVMSPATSQNFHRAEMTTVSIFSPRFCNHFHIKIKKYFRNFRFYNVRKAISVPPHQINENSTGAKIRNYPVLPLRLCIQEVGVLLFRNFRYVFKITCYNLAY